MHTISVTGYIIRQKTILFMKARLTEISGVQKHIRKVGKRCNKANFKPLRNPGQLP